MKYLPDLYIKPFQVVSHSFNVHAALFREIPRRIFFLAPGFGMLHQIKKHGKPPPIFFSKIITLASLDMQPPGHDKKPWPTTGASREALPVITLTFPEVMT
jgi:hypothetical protein